MTKNIYYLNALFDLSLAKYKTDKIQRSASEMGCLFIPLSKQGDKVLLDFDVSNTYYEYLNQAGIIKHTKTKEPLQKVGFQGVAWGWNASSQKRLDIAGANCLHPDFEIIKKVNSRSFCNELNKKNQTGVKESVYLNKFKDIVDYLKKRTAFPCVIKPEFGNAGYGFIHKNNSTLNNREISHLKSLVSKNNGVIIEPWLDRIVDIASICTINSDGSIFDILHHRILSGKYGTSFGDWFGIDEIHISKRCDILDTMIFSVAKTLYNEGYFGQLGIDSFIWQDENKKQHLAPCVEINARYSMSNIAYALHKKCAANKASLFRFISKKRHTLPETYEELFHILGNDKFNSSTNQGVLLVSPLRVRHLKALPIQPVRSAFFLVADTEEKLLLLDDKLRKLF